LVVRGKRGAFVLEGGSGQVAHVIAELPGPYRAIDLDGDGVPELIGYQDVDDQGRPVGRLHRFRGHALATGAPTPVMPQEELREWVPLPWVSIMREEAEWASDKGDPSLPFAFAAVVIFLVCFGLRVLRKGWRGLWFPGVTSLVFMFGMAGLALVSHEWHREPWERYSWEGWYWILFFAVFFTGMLMLGWLGVRWLYRLLCWAFRLIFRRRVAAGKAASA
jgi:hypothetical protein